MIFSCEKFCLIAARKQMSFTEISKKSNIDRGSISRYANGKYKPKPKNIGRLAKALDVEISEIIMSTTST